MPKIHIQYFAALREARGLSNESVETDRDTPGGLYQELSQRHGFRLAEPQVKVAVNGVYVAMETPLMDDDKVVFIPPVAGG